MAERPPPPRLPPRSTRVDKRRFEQPDGIVSFARDNGIAARVELGGVRVVRETLPPGWRWTHDMQPMVGTTVCETEHALP